MGSKSYSKSIFINCPFDDAYKSFFYTIVFTIIKCNYIPRCALEESDSGEIRIEKIVRIIRECKYGIHDLSVTKLDRKYHLPRFNMPFELGIFLSSKYFGIDEQSNKKCLIFEKNSHSYEKYISDIKGQDIYFHSNQEDLIIRHIRNWLKTNTRKSSLPGGAQINKEFIKFKKWLPKKCVKESIKMNEMTFRDFAEFAYNWIESN